MMEVLIGQVIRRMNDSERLLIIDADGREIYRGYVANFEHSALDESNPVKEIALKTQVFKRGNWRDRVPQGKKEAVKEECLKEFSFSDLEFVIYQQITLGEIT